MLDSNLGHLSTETTALLTVPQPLPKTHHFINPIPTLMAFTGVTNAHGPHPSQANSMQVSSMQSDDRNRK